MMKNVLRPICLAPTRSKLERMELENIFLLLDVAGMDAFLGDNPAEILEIVRGEDDALSAYLGRPTTVAEWLKEKGI